MRVRSACLLSACFHASLFWLIAVADDAWSPRFAVREGQAVHLATRAARRAAAPEVVDSRLHVEPPPIAMSLSDPMPVNPQWPAEPLDSDQRPVVRPPVEELLRRRAQRSLAAAEVPFAERIVDSRLESSPESEGREVPPLMWGPIPETQLPTIEAPADRPVITSAQPAPTQPITDEGDASADRLPSQTVSGAQSEQLPIPLPKNPEPEYPEELLRQRIGGTVVLRVSVQADGTVGRVRVERSSGVAQLDAAAVTAVQRWRFEPARRWGVPVAIDVRVPITFTIRSPAARFTPNP
jgi:protein TonB